MGTELKPEIKDGMSQSERYLSSLDPAYFGIDEKDTTDLLKMLADLSGQFNYYNFSNQIEGDWNAFLTSDIDILISLLSKLDSRTTTDAYRKLTAKVQGAESEKQLISSLKNVLQFILDFIQLQINYHDRFETAGNLGHAFHFETATPAFMRHLQKLYTYNRNAEELFGDETGLSFDQKLLDYLYQSNFDVIEDPFTHGSSLREKILLAIPYFDQLVSDLDTHYGKLLDTCRHYLKTQSLDGNVYDPHVALLITFLHLYHYLQQPVNQLMKKHLDFFYRDIIGIQNRKEQLDLVHLVIEPAPAVNGTFTLNSGEQVFAEIPGYQEKLLYNLVNDTQISGAQIAELKTLFISNKQQVKGKKSTAGDVSELQVYQGDYPLSTTAWPLLGEEQSELSLQQKTMLASDVGLLVASPLFYQTDGQRDFKISFFIQRQSFNQFEQHVENLSAASAISKEVLMLELLNQSFVIAITGATGWTSIQDYAVSKASAADKDPYIEVKFKMDPAAEAVAVYNNKVHGHDFGLQWPIVRLLLNNLSFHHPYTFLSFFIIERITVKVEVKGSKRVKLKNNLGDLYSGAPFQPFGPTPVVGSYLDIKNTAIFNRYTTDFCLRLYWFNLPAEDDGFKGYYTGYDYPFTNQSFKIQLNSTADAKAVTDPEEQQVFQLFDYGIENGKEQLKARTKITGIDFRRIKFDNTLALDQEWTSPEPLFNQGTVRLELTAPFEAFGQRMYSRVFTDAAEYNTKRFVKKRPMPNQPYVPVVKSLTIDYTLEHSELTSGNSYTEEEEIIMVHLYPFGYDKFYTGKNAKHNFFVPPADQESNLFIGFRDLVPGQELSLLFQLSEDNFHHSVQEPEKINWSHLAGNQWVSIPAGGVLQDTTVNFINSGVVTLKIPEWIEKNNTILNPDLYWLRASLPGKSSVNARATAIFPQAVIARRQPGQILFPAHSYMLPKEAVKGFYRNVPGVKAVRQFFTSFGGQPQESERQYNIRVSERLRHKQRQLSILDISQAVLDAFPQILMVKCYSGADIHVVVIPKEQEDGSFFSQEPRVNLSLLYAIKKFLTQSVSPFIRIEVANPIYERIMVVATVKFKHPETVRQSNGHYLKLMDQDIKKYISAWLYNPKSDFRIGSKIYVSEILNYLQHRSYIDYITGFSMIHFYKVWDKREENWYAQIRDTSVSPTDYLRGSTQGAILIAADTHLLTVTETPSPEEAEKSGIGDFSIGSGLLINPPPAAETPDQDTTPLPDELYDFIVF
ncbi:hypothetical protein [Pedobacter sp. L105]|uniref:hypothetical protein n=1 Tax=Pedobacter sp. L105 TaxID=1641871 RepID=UPI00131BF8DA|nr:hypothetical protein [Pedobacter sp. L105]